MADTNFTDGNKAAANRIIAAWLNDVNKLRYQTGDATRGAALLDMVQSGTGAVARSVQSKERDAISVLDFAANGVSGVPVDPTGVVDSTLGIQAAINAVGNGGILWFPPGTYKTTAQLNLLNRSSITLLGAGHGTCTIRYMGVQDATKAVIKIQTSAYCKIEGFTITSQSGASTVIANSLAGFGIYITSEGNNPITQYNQVIGCFVKWHSSCGVCVGNFFVDADVNVDCNTILDCLVSNNGIGIGIYNTNTNMTMVTHCAIASSATYNLEIGLGARGQTLDNVLFTPDAGQVVLYHIHIKKQISGPIVIRNMVCEIFNEKFLQVDPVSTGVFAYPMITMENILCTNDTTVAGSKLIDYQGSGDVIMRNCRFAGGSATSGGAGATLEFKPPNTASAGGLWLITENVHLHDGATFSVTTDNLLTAFYRWLEIGTKSGGASAIDVFTNRQSMRLNGGISLEVANLRVSSLGAGVTIDNIGSMGRSCWKVTIDKAAWIAAALTQDIVIATFPAKCRLVAAYCDTTIKYAGLAGTIQLMISGTGFDGSIIAAHDVKTAIVTKGLLDADMGTGLTRAARIQDALLISWTSSSVQPQVRLASSVGNIGTGAVTNLTTGSTTIYLITETMP